MKAKCDNEPEVLLDLDAFDFARNYIVKCDAVTKGRPSGIKYRLTLHDPKR
jgi:hypothetical protein